MKESEKYRRDGYVVKKHDNERTTFFDEDIEVFSIQRMVASFSESFYLAEVDNCSAIGGDREEAVEKLRSKIKSNLC